MSNTIFSIQYLRGIAALLVVFFHVSGTLNNVYAQANLGSLLFSGGISGIDLFFMISGFIMVYATSKKEEDGVKRFVVRRFFRIYPTFLVCLLLYNFIVVNSAGVGGFVRSLFLLPISFSGPAPYFSYNILYPAWTLLYEVIFYAIFAFSMLVSHKYRSVLAASIIVLLCVPVQIYMNGAFSFAGLYQQQETAVPFVTGMLRVVSSSMMLLFVAGMVIGEVFLRLKDVPVSDAGKGILRYAAFCLFSFFVVCFFSGFKSGMGLTGYGIWAAALMIGALCLEKANGMTGHKALFFLGEISYSLYLTHVITIGFMNRFAGTFTIYPTSIGFSRFLFLSLTSIAVAIVVYYLVERPSISLAKTVVAKLRTRSENRKSLCAA